MARCYISCLKATKLQQAVSAATAVCSSIYGFVHSGMLNTTYHSSRTLGVSATIAKRRHSNACTTTAVYSSRASFGNSTALTMGFAAAGVLLATTAAQAEGVTQSTAEGQNNKSDDQNQSERQTGSFKPEPYPWILYRCPWCKQKGVIRDVKPSEIGFGGMRTKCFNCNKPLTVHDRWKESTTVAGKELIAVWCRSMPFVGASMDLAQCLVYGEASHCVKGICKLAADALTFGAESFAVEGLVEVAHVTEAVLDITTEFADVILVLLYEDAGSLAEAASSMSVTRLCEILRSAASQGEPQVSMLASCLLVAAYALGGEDVESGRCDARSAKPAAGNAEVLAEAIKIAHAKPNVIAKKSELD